MGYTYMDGYCEAEIKLGHETVRCSLTESNHGQMHENDMYGGWPPCKHCGGLEMHSAKCPHPEEACPSRSWSVVRWKTGGKPKITCGQYARVPFR